MSVPLADWFPVGRGEARPSVPAPPASPCPLPAHAGLWLDRMLRQPRPENGGEWPARRELYDAAADALKIGSRAADDPPALAAYRPFFERWREEVRGGVPGFSRKVETVEAVSRLLLHPASGESVTEGSLLLHHTYGVPYLPGSALKGAARRRLRQLGEPGQELDKRLLGTVKEGDEEGGQASWVDFPDALWIPEAPPGAKPGWSPLAVDVVNPHHSDYSTRDKERPHPTDSDQPIPVHRLTVAPGARFLLVVEAPAASRAAAWLDWLVDDVLLPALARDGLGAWSAAGYGRLRKPGSRETGAETPAGGAETSGRCWHHGREVRYKPGRPTIVTVLPDGQDADIEGVPADELLAALPEALRARLTNKKKKRKATLDVEVEREGLRWKIVDLRPAEGGG